MSAPEIAATSEYQFGFGINLLLQYLCSPPAAALQRGDKVLKPMLPIPISKEIFQSSPFSTLCLSWVMGEEASMVRNLSASCSGLENETLSKGSTPGQPVGK